MVHTCSDGTSAQFQVIMQFGKASNNVYIMDYNPTIISAVQAFGIALSTFDGKLRM